MNIDIHLSNASIESAIRKLTRIKDNVGDDSTNLAEILASEGAEIAKVAYGGSPVDAVALPGGNGEAYIVVYGDMPAIAEFGAGDATVTPSGLFDTTALDAEVWAGSYSLYEGTMDYYFLKHWKFGGQWYTEVQPHLGLAQAKMFLMNSSTRIAQEVFQID